MGDKCTITRPEQQGVLETRKTSDKWETSVYKIMQPRPETSETSVETSVLGGNCNIMRPKQSQRGRNAPGDKCKIMRPGTQPFQRSKNPSQVNLFGEKN